MLNYIDHKFWFDLMKQESQLAFTAGDLNDNLNNNHNNNLESIPFCKK